MRKPLVRYAVLVNILLLFFPVNSFTGIKIGMVVGQSRTLKVGNVKRVAIGNPDVADFSIISVNEVRVVAKAKGITTLEIWDKSGKMSEYDLEILSIDTGDMIKEIKALLGNDIMRIAKIKPLEGGKVLIEGVYDTPDDMKRVAQVLESYDDRVINFLQPSKILKETSSYRIAELIGINTVEVSMVNKSIFLDGMVPNKEDKERAGKIAKMFSKKVVNGLRIGSDRMIQVDVKIYEMNAEFTSDIDLNLISPAGIASKVDYRNYFIQKSKTGLISSIISINNSLEMAIGQGKGKLLARPKLVTANGGKAKFRSGGERGYRMLSSQGVPSIKWKEFGIKLDIEPYVNRLKGEDSIELKISAEISELDEISTTVAVAALNSSNAEVNVNMKANETLLIAGLLKNKKVKTISRFPILGYIPIIELFFKTEREAIVEKELLMFITPSFVSARNVPMELTDIREGQEQYYERLKQRQSDIEE